MRSEFAGLRGSRRPWAARILRFVSGNPWPIDPAAPVDAGGLFAKVPAQTGLSSKVVGLSVYNSENTDLGTIKDIAFDANGVKAYIVAVGGFLGMGDHYIAVRPSAINITYDASKDKWQALMNTDIDQLKSAPEFKYSSAG